jgi:hypothetical protein
MGWTFYNSSGQRLSTAATSIDVLDIDGATDIGAAIVDADLFIIDDGAGGTNRKTAASRIKTYVGAAPSQADQTAIEAETNEDTYVPPDLLNFHPGIAKAWGNVEQIGTHTFLASRNMDSAITDSGVGLSTVSFTTDFSGNNYGMGMTRSSFGQATTSSKNTGTIRLDCTDSGGTQQDSDDLRFVAFGDQ